MNHRYHQLQRLLLPALILLAQHSVHAQTHQQKQLELARLRLENRFASVNEFDTVSLLASYSNKDHSGYVDTSGRELKIQVDGKITSLYGFINGYAIVGVTTGADKTHYIINRTGKVISTLMGLDNIRNWSNIDRIITGDKNGKYGVIDRKGKVIIPFKYYLLEPIDKNLLRAYVGKQLDFTVGVINYQDKVIVPAVYRQLYYYNHTANYLLACDHKDLVVKHGRANYRIRQAFPVIYPEQSRMFVDFQHHLILNKIDPVKPVLYNLQLDTIKTITGNYDDMKLLNDGLIAVRKWKTKHYDSTGAYTGATGSVTRIVNGNGQFVFPLELEDAEPFIEGFSAVLQSNGKRGYYGYLSRKGHLKIPCQYINGTPFRNGYAKVRVSNNRYYVIDYGGRYVMDTKAF